MDPPLLTPQNPVKVLPTDPDTIILQLNGRTNPANKYQVPSSTPATTSAPQAGTGTRAPPQQYQIPQASQPHPPSTMPIQSYGFQHVGSNPPIQAPAMQGPPPMHAPPPIQPPPGYVHGNAQPAGQFGPMPPGYVTGSSHAAPAPYPQQSYPQQHQQQGYPQQGHPPPHPPAGYPAHPPAGYPSHPPAHAPYPSHPPPHAPYPSHPPAPYGAHPPAHAPYPVHPPAPHYPPVAMHGARGYAPAGYPPHGHGVAFAPPPPFIRPAYHYPTVYMPGQAFVIPIGLPPHIAGKMMQASAAFRMFDTNWSGSLSKKEWKRALHYLGYHVPKGYAKMMFYSVDTNHSGSISEREFCEWWIYSGH